ncbi:hypothetical protein DNH61_05950 [Paenibacillus sambharensis]|uniref:ABC transporter domain-containing protein n=1 Tax=Paenibacillus sambharensis TaxID=1803190 RepID=A0A2W1LDK4_9BACL|nr:ATP-binding cassette domain-containing protein [Paenibacillus sambharensis]PZD96739.1 hypothetical protein DNH61_05950 [Paenibacillus sambharensis]
MSTTAQAVQPLLVSVQRLSKSYGKKLVLDAIDFEMPQASIYVLTGANGAGKSVFLQCLLHYETIDSGRIEIDGRPLSDRLYLRRNTSLISSDQQQFIDLLTPGEYFAFITDIYNIPSSATQRIRDWAEDLNVSKELDTLIANLSFGTKKKIQVLASMLIAPKLLVCDEIYEGLDTDAVAYMQRLFLQRKEQGLGTLLTTHIAGYGQDIAERTFRLANHQIHPADEPELSRGCL